MEVDTKPEQPELRVVLPGDSVKQVSQDASIKLGPGVMQLAPRTANAAGPGGSQKSSPADKIHITATRSGILGHQAASSGKKEAKNAPEVCWVEAQGKRYILAQGEPVIGVITARFAEGYRVDIGGSQSATLDALAFEDATKRNKPNLKVGQVIYGRVSLALPFCEPEIECFDAKTGKAKGFGELNGGMLMRGLELGKCRAMLSPSHPLLPRLGAKFPFELAIGMNGRIWVKAAEPQKTIELMKAIQDA